MLQVQITLTNVFFTGTAIMVGLVVFILGYVIIYQQKVSRFNKTIQQKELDKQREVYLALTVGEEKERKRLSEELHDGIGAKLSGIKMKIEYLCNKDGEYINQHFNDILISLNDSINELREVSHNLQPSVIGAKGLKNAIADFIENLQLNNQTNYKLFWQVNAINFKCQQDELTVYRIASELLHNIHKHAQAKNASLQVSYDDNILQIIADDDGVGFDNNVLRNGIGLSNLIHRSEVMAGKFTIDSRVGKGTTIIVEIPIINT